MSDEARSPGALQRCVRNGCGRLALNLRDKLCREHLFEVDPEAVRRWDAAVAALGPRTGFLG